MNFQLKVGSVLYALASLTVMPLSLVLLLGPLLDFQAWPKADFSAGPTRQIAQLAPQGLSASHPALVRPAAAGGRLLAGGSGAERLRVTAPSLRVRGDVSRLSPSLRGDVGGLSPRLTRPRPSARALRLRVAPVRMLPSPAVVPAAAAAPEGVDPGLPGDAPPPSGQQDQHAGLTEHDPPQAGPGDPHHPQGNSGVADPRHLGPTEHDPPRPGPAKPGHPQNGPGRSDRPQPAVHGNDKLGNRQSPQARIRKP